MTMERKIIRAKLGLKGEEIALRVEVSRTYWSALENGRVPGPKLLSALERVFSVRPEYVLKGSGPMFSKLASASQQVDEGGDALVVREGDAAWAGHTSERLVLALPTGAGTRRYEVIPKIVPATGSARRKPVKPDLLEPAGDLAFSVDWLRRHLGHTSGRLATLQVRGDAMVPALHEGDTVVIDTAVQRVEASGLYVIALRGDRLVRRVQRLLDDSLQIMSDNPAYGTETVSPAQARSLEVVGRVVWPRVA